MTNEEWKKIIAARELLGLGEKATQAEIKKAFRRLSKKHHPDLAQKGEQGGEVTIQALTEAYQTLLDYCQNYRFPLVPGEDQPLEGEDWWMDRFGDDPLWGPGPRDK
jgi:preprotein translocase subunit Sec63